MLDSTNQWLIFKLFYDWCLPSSPCAIYDNSVPDTLLKWCSTNGRTGRSPRQRHDLLGTSRMHCKPRERELFNGFSVKDKQLGVFLFILLNGFGASGTRQVSCQNFNKLSGLQGFTWLLYFHFLYFLPLFFWAIKLLISYCQIYSVP